MALVVKSPLADAGDIKKHRLNLGFRKIPGGGHDNPLQDSFLENPWTEGPDGLQSVGSLRDLTEVTQHACTHE